jgi:HNH endonuclease
MISTPPAPTSRRVRCHPMPTEEVLQKLWDRMVDKFDIHENGCWVWNRTISSQGYGRLGRTGTTNFAHRISYWFHVGGIPEGLDLDHKCRCRACINPSHLEPVTNKVNAQRGRAGAHNREKTECAKGHAFDSRNTGVRANGTRYCRECLRANSILFNRTHPERRREISQKYKRKIRAQSLCQPN